MDFTNVTSALEARGYAVTVCPTKEDAAAYLNKEIDGTRVGFGGSMTLKELGLFSLLSKHNEVYSHWNTPDWRTGAEVLADAAKTAVFVTSVNGLAETGELINIDGTGNRVSSTLYGHKKVYFVVGRNKLAPTYDEALWRARNIASPKNAQRLGRKTPCAAKGEKCYDCKSPERICRALVVLWEKVTSCDMEVVLVDEELGY